MKKRGSSLVIIIILVLSLVVFGGIWAYQNGLLFKQQNSASNNAANPAVVDTATKNIETVTPTDSVSDISRDLSGTDMSSIDKDVNSAKSDANTP